MLNMYRRGMTYWVRGTLHGKRVHRSLKTASVEVAERALAAIEEHAQSGFGDALGSPPDKLHEIARSIWRETYRHETLLEWHEVRGGTLHYQRTMNAALAALATIKGSDDGSIWKPIPGFPMYEASSKGNIRRAWLEDGTPVFHSLKPTQKPSGHLFVSVYSDKKQARTGVHRLVALTFLGPPPPDKPLACHNDGNPGDNRPENLRWDTHKENSSDRERHRAERGGLSLVFNGVEKRPR